MEIGCFPFHRPWEGWPMGPVMGICHPHCCLLSDRWHLCAVLQATVLSGFRVGSVGLREAVGTITEVEAGARQVRKTQINNTPLSSVGLSVCWGPFRPGLQMESLACTSVRRLLPPSLLTRLPYPTHRRPEVTG